MKDQVGQAHQLNDDCSLIEEKSSKASESFNKTKGRPFTKKRDRKHEKDSAAEEIFSLHFSRLQNKYPQVSCFAGQLISITTLSRIRTQVLQSYLGTIFFSWPRLSLKAVLPGSLSLLMVPSCSNSKNMHTRVALLVLAPNSKCRSNSLCIVSPVSKKHLRVFSTIETLYNNATVSFSSGRRLSYLTRSLAVVTVSLDTCKPSVRQIKSALTSYLDKTLSTDALLCLSFEGLLVELIGLKEVIVLWGRWNNSPFICIFYKRQMALRLAVFDLLSAYTSSVIKVSLIPAELVKDRTDSLIKDEDLYLAIYGTDKMAIHRLREAPENRFADKEVPCCTLDHMLTVNLN